MSGAKLDAIDTSSGPLALSLGFSARDAAGLVAAAAIALPSDPKGAACLAETATECDPGSFDAWLLLASAHAKNQRYVPAITAYQRAIALHPQDVPAWVALAEAFLAVRDYPSMTEALRRAMQLDPNADDASGRRARALVARTMKALKGAGA